MLTISARAQRTDCAENKHQEKRTQNKNIEQGTAPRKMKFRRIESPRTETNHNRGDSKI
jgi:hypothetical protein